MQRQLLRSLRRVGLQSLLQSPAAAEGMASRSRDPADNPKVVRLRELVSAAEPTDGWEKSWAEGVTPWDLGSPTPIVAHLVQSGALPNGRALVPGCGSGYDVVALATADRFVVGLDISEKAIEIAKELSSSSPNAAHFTFVAADFFTWTPSELFDLIFEYTFFFAINPSMRYAWAKKVSDLLKPNGELITLIYTLTGQRGGPPFNNTVADYEEVLVPLGFKPVSVEDNELSVRARKGCEKLVRWKRHGAYSSL